MVRIILPVLLVSVLAGCAASDKAFEMMMRKPAHDTAVALPDWITGAPPSDVPPKPTDPGYAKYKAKLEGKPDPTQPVNK